MVWLFTSSESLCGRLCLWVGRGQFTFQQQHRSRPSVTAERPYRRLSALHHRNCPQAQGVSATAESDGYQKPFLSFKPSAAGYCLVMVWRLQWHIWHYRAPRQILLAFASGWAVKILARTSLGMLGWHVPSFTMFWTVHSFPFPSRFSPPTPPKKTNKKLPYLGLFYPEVNIKSSPPRLLKPMMRPPTVNYPFSRSTFARLSCFSSFPAFPTHFTTPWDAGSCLSAWNSWESVALSFEQSPQTSLIPYINRKWRPSWGGGSESAYLPSNLLFTWVLCATIWSGDLSSVEKCVKLYSYRLF